MKTTPIAALLLVIMTLSCQSEYERQLAKGKDLVQKQIISNRYASPKKDAFPDSKTNSKLENYAQLSGNKRLFKVELKSYQESLQQRQVATKYP